LRINLAIYFDEYFLYLFDNSKIILRGLIMSDINKSIFIESLKNRILLFDGAMGTFLQLKGLTTDDCPEEWNMSHPDVVKEIHKSYFDAGSDVVETNSFGGSKSKLAKYNYGDRTYEFNKRAAELAKEVCPEGKFVAGSIGPCGEMLEPYGAYTAEQVYESFVDQVKGLRDGGVDVFCVETMMDVEEVKIIVKVVKDLTDLPVITTMTFTKSPKGYKTLMGNSATDIARELKIAGADIIGSNCGTGITDMIEILKELKQGAGEHLFMIQPNAGLPEMIEGKSVYKESPEVMSDKLSDLLKVGVNIVGGCCGTTPGHIKAFKNILINLS
jgi:5-methyltetrahydrofolate--homocysteine methyltransferase